MTPGNQSQTANFANDEVKHAVEDLPHSTPASELPHGAQLVETGPIVGGYKFTYTTGPFLLPQATHSLDWGMLNNDTAPQKVRVTVFKCNLTSLKTTEPPGPLDFVLNPGQSIHNANNAVGGFFYEIQVMCNSQLIFPYASAWPGGVGDPLAGSVVTSAAFIRNLS